MFINSFIDYVKVKQIDGDEIPLYKVLEELISSIDYEYVDHASYDLKVIDDTPTLSSLSVRTNKKDIVMITTGHGVYFLTNEL